MNGVPTEAPEATLANPAAAAGTPALTLPAMPAALTGAVDASAAAVAGVGAGIPGLDMQQGLDMQSLAAMGLLGGAAAVPGLQGMQSMQSMQSMMGMGGYMNLLAGGTDIASSLALASMQGFGGFAGFPGLDAYAAYAAAGGGLAASSLALAGLSGAMGSTAAGQRTVGKVKNYLAQSGFGFFGVPGHEKDVFFGKRDLPPDIQERTDLAGATFSFELVIAADGRPQAKMLDLMAEPDPGTASVLAHQGGIDPRTGIDFGDPGDRYYGTIKSYSPGGSNGGGYGFIAAPAAGGDCWFSRPDLPEQLRESAPLNIKGAEVVFSLRSSREGKRQAKSIEVGNLGGAIAVKADGTVVQGYHQQQQQQQQRGRHGGLQIVPPMGAANRRVQGRVRNWSETDGAGFLSVDGAGDIYFSNKDLPMDLHGRNLMGLLLEFEIVIGPTGKSIKNVRCLDAGGTGGAGKSVPVRTGGTRVLGALRDFDDQQGTLQPKDSNSAIKEFTFPLNELPPAIRMRVQSDGAAAVLSKGRDVLFTMDIGQKEAREVMLIPGPDDQLSGEVVSFSSNSGYGFLRPAKDSCFTHDVYFTLKDLTVPLPDDMQRSIHGVQCKFCIVVTPEGRPQARRIELTTKPQVSAFQSHDMAQTTGQTHQGTVRTWKREAGYGFLACPALGRDVWFGRKEAPADWANRDPINVEVVFELWVTADQKHQARGLQEIPGMPQASMQAPVAFGAGAFQPLAGLSYGIGEKRSADGEAEGAPDSKRWPM